MQLGSGLVGYSHLLTEPGLALFSEAVGAGTDRDTGTSASGDGPWVQSSTASPG